MRVRVPQRAWLDAQSCSQWEGNLTRIGLPDTKPGCWPPPRPPFAAQPPRPDKALHLADFDLLICRNAVRLRPTRDKIGCRQLSTRSQGVIDITCALEKTIL